MKKSDLRSGDLVKTEEGNIYMVLLNTKAANNHSENILLNLITGNYIELNLYSEDLTNNFDEDCHIKEICSENYVGNNFRKNNLLKHIGSFYSTWKREDKKEVTISEIEKELGYPIKIVKEN